MLPLPPTHVRVVASATVDADNPWPGPEAFGEADAEYFFGRDTAIRALTRLVLHNRLVILYGRSGLGKTSLLQAGLFPRLRNDASLPIYVRMAFGTPGDSVHALRSRLKAAIEIAAESANVEIPALDPGRTLWEWFYAAGAHFFTAESRRVRPVLVFDQLEEAFTHGRRNEAASAVTNQFFEELTDLIRGSPPASVVRQLEQHPGAALEFSMSRDACGVLLALRQEFLAELLRLRSWLPTLLDHRFELTAMRRADAGLVVTGPGRDLVEEGVAAQIVSFVARARRSADDETTDDTTVDPAILSIFCRELNNKRQARGLPRITADLVQGTQNAIIADFYERAVSSVSPDVRRFIERTLVTESGYRNSVALDEARTAGVPEDAVETLVANRLLRQEGTGPEARLELTHDVLTDPVVRSRNLRRVLDARARARWRLMVVGLAVVVIVGAAFLLLRVRQTDRELRASNLLDRSRGLHRSDGSPLDQSLLLAIEALRLSSKPDAALQLGELTRLLPRPIARLNPGGSIRSLVLSPREDTVVVLYQGARDREAQLWQLSPPREVRQLAHDGSVNDVAFSDDGRMVATAGGDGAVKLWNDSGMLIAVIEPPGDARGQPPPAPVAVNGVAFKPRTQVLAAAANDGTVRLWDAANPEAIRRLGAASHPLAATAVAFNPRGDLLASAGGDGVRVWSVQTDGALRKFRDLPPRSTALALTFADPPETITRALQGPPAPDVLLIADVSGDLSVVWLPQDRRASAMSVAVRLPLAVGIESHPALPRDSRVLLKLLARAGIGDRQATARAGVGQPSQTAALVSSSVGVVRLITDGKAQLLADQEVPSSDSQQWPETARFTHKSAVVAAAVGSSNSIVLTGDDGGTVVLWELDTRLPFTAFSGDGRRAAGVTKSGIVWSDEPFKPPFRTLAWPDPASAPEEMALSSDGRLIAAASTTKVVLWNAESGAVLAQTELRPPPPRPDRKTPQDRLVPSLAVASAGVLVPRSRIVQLFDAKTLKLLWEPEVPALEWAMADPDGRYVVGGTVAGDLQVWSQNNRSALGEIPSAHGDIAVRANAFARIAFLPHGPEIALCRGTTVEFWNLSSVALRPPDFKGPCRAIAFDETGQLLAVGMEEGSVRVVDSRTGKHRFTVATQAPVAAVAFSGSGEYLAAESDDGLLHVWDRRGNQLSRIPGASRYPDRHEVRFSASDRFILNNGTVVAWQPQDVADAACERLLELARQQLIAEPPGGVSPCDSAPDRSSR